MRYNLPPRKREFARDRPAAGRETSSGLDETAAAERAITAVEKLRGRIGIPDRLRDFGAKPEQLRGFAEKAFAIKRGAARQSARADGRRSGRDSAGGVLSRFATLFYGRRRTPVRRILRIASETENAGISRQNR